MTAQCKLCGKDINPHDIGSWKEVTGFVGGPKKDSMVLRTDTGAYACTPCIHKAKDGQAPDQASLFEPAPKVYNEQVDITWKPDAVSTTFLDDDSGIGGE